MDHTEHSKCNEQRCHRYSIRRFNLTVNGNTDLKGAVIGIRGGLPSRFVGIAYDLLNATQTHRHVQPNQVAS